MKKHTRNKTENNLKIHGQDSSKVTIDPAKFYEGQAFDIMLHAWFGKMTGWLSPASLTLAIYDWWSHLLINPAKQIDLVKEAYDSFFEFNTHWMHYSGLLPQNICTKCKPPEEDIRFKAPEWQQFPFNLYSHAFLLSDAWWNQATKSIRGVSKHHRDVVNFVTRQMLDMLSPSNYMATNPEVIHSTIAQGGMNLFNGYQNFIEDACRIKNDLPPVGTENYKVGEQVAITPGKVIYRNELIELIQYEPTTAQVYAEPILIIPAWIMKYYILDLSPHNSLVKYLVKKGHTVFMISWKNPTSDDRNMDLDDYINLGIMHSLKVINAIVPGKKVHATGYCLGGTLLMIAAAAMALMGDDRLQTITLFAAQVDFKEAGELLLFIDQSQLSYLEDIMWEKGYLDGNQMAWAFSMLRSNDLIWSRMIHDYLLGKRRGINDLIAWDYDTTRLPYKMHTEYLNNLFLNNDLVEGRYKVGRKKIALTDIKVPIFAVSTVKDHVSPWKSVYKIKLFTNTDVTFVLTSGGHNAGIVSEPGHKNRSYQMSTRYQGDKYISTDHWFEQTPKKEGSWWPEWDRWLDSHSTEKTDPPPLGNPKKDYQILCDAPGTYVLQK